MISNTKIQLVTPICDNYNIHELKQGSRGKRRRTLPAVRKQTTAAFLTALGDGDIKTAQLLLDSNISVSVTDRLGRTALHLAICLPPTNSSFQICRYLLDRFSDVNKGDVFGMSAFFYAVSAQNLAMVREMLKGAKVDKCDKFGNTSLHHAAATGNVFTVTAIAKLTKQMNKINILGFTPLMIASKLGHVEVAKALTQSGAVSGTIRDVSSYLTADEWARFSHRFTEIDLRDLKLAELHFKKNLTSSAISRSKHPDCKSTTDEVYKTTSRTLPISVGIAAEDQTQLMIKRVILLRKLSEFFNTNGKRLQIKSHVYENKVDIRENMSGNVKSISVNDLLDQHLSKLTLGGTKPGLKEKPSKHKSQTQHKTEQLTDSGSDDSILERQAQQIERVALLRKKRRNRAAPSENTTKRSPLEPSIVTLVHGSCKQPAIQTPRNSINSREQSPVPSNRINHLNLTPREMLTPEDQEVLIPDCTTLDSQFVRQSRGDDLLLKLYHTDHTHHHTAESLLLCEKVRYGRRPRVGYGLPHSGRVGENPTLSQHYSSLARRKKSKTKRPKSKTKDPMKGFGPWVTESERSHNSIRAGGAMMVPEIKIDFR